LPELDASTVVRTPLRTALRLAALFAVITFLVHLTTSLWGMHLGYGYYRDDMYYMVCAHHLDWGYVDQPPLVALQARAAMMLFGTSPTGVRILSFAASGIMVGLTGMLAWQLGGRGKAQVLAMTAILSAPVLLGTGNFLSMNSFEPCFWMGALFAILRITEGTGGWGAWVIFGVLSGLGIENKHSTVFFLTALLIGLLLSPQRRILLSKGCALGVSLLILIALPNFIWEWVRHFPTYELLNNVAHSDKNVRYPPLGFLWEQIKILLFENAVFWIGGLVWLIVAPVARPWRFVALTYLVFLGMMMAMHGKDYYLAPIYPVLFAAGTVALERLTSRKWPFVVGTINFAGILCFATGPVVLTILPPERYVAYTAIFAPNSSKFEKYDSPLPEILSDRFGWSQMVEGFAARYDALPPDVRARTGIFCNNYGEASAVNVLGPKLGLPTAISGHQNYFYWGWGGYTAESVLTLGYDAKDFSDYYEQVIDLGPFDNPWTMDFEHRHYFWLRHRKRGYAQDWPEFKHWL